MAETNWTIPGRVPIDPKPFRLGEDDQLADQFLGMVLRAEFIEAAEAYADILLRTETIVDDIEEVVKRRERFLTVRALMTAT